jgi:conjugative transposon TraJ protein
MVLLQISAEFKSLHDLLDHLYDEMLPLCSNFINIGRALGGLGALAFIGSSIWRSIVNAEPIDFFPLLRPFAIGLCIALFPLVLGALNGVLKPLSSATNSLVQEQNQDIINLQARKEKLLASKTENLPFENDAAFDKELEGKEWYNGTKAGLYFDKMAYDVKKNFREWMKEALELVYQTAALAINTVRTLFLIILSILGPIAFGFAIWPGFEGNLQNWLGRYITVSLWLPVANIFGAVIARLQVFMLTTDITRIENGTNLTTQDLGYLIFLLLAICCYAFVPTAAGWVVQSTGVGNALRPLTSVGGTVVNSASSVTGAAAGRVAGGAVAMVGQMLTDSKKNGVTPDTIKNNKG